MPGLRNSKRWDILSSQGESERLLCESLGITPLVARVLVARGVSSPQDARCFLAPSLRRDWRNPLEIPGMSQAADRVQDALVAGETIAVFGDFDVDGMTSTCLLTLGLRELGGDVHPYIPHRFGEGYGLSREALDRVIADSRPNLIITVDNGIAAAHEVAWLLDQGIDVVITDHHEPGDLVPRDVPVTDPKLSADCPSRELAGAGVALKLLAVLGERFGNPDLWWSYVDLAAMGTVSDMMILQGENRSLVAEGIKRMRASTRPGIVALAASSGCDLTQITSDNLPFSLIPRINAAGRMGTTEVAFDLLMSQDPAEAATLAAALERANTQRREIEAALSREALNKLKDSYHGERIIVLAGEGWHEGVKGIVASRIVSAYHVPTLIFTITDGIARGSGRSVGSIDLFHVIEQCSDVLVRFGGHSGAVGVTCEEARIDELRGRLQEIVSQLPEEQFQDRGEVTAIASLSELSLENILALDTLQPFGQGNKKPLFGIEGVFMRNRARVGYDANHLRFIATDGVASVPAIMFRTPHMNRAYACEGLVDLVADAVGETWQGRTQAKLMVRDIVYRVGETTSAKAPTQNGAHEAGTTALLSRKEAASLPVDQLTDYLREQMIGSSSLLPAQKAALDQLAEGCSTLCVMATGRGKSLVFHIHAARIALSEGRASVFVYPLRALVSDQSFHLGLEFEKLGMSVRVLTGESSQQERQETFDALRKGQVDVVLTTPEFLAIHTNRFASTGRVGFLVIDEAHHAGMKGAGSREAYGEFDRVLAELNNPTTLAVTATASAPVAHEVCRLLGVRESNVVVDRTVRPNLMLEDHRDLRERDLYLASVIASGGKTVVYVNSRDQAVALVRELRVSVPELGERIAFYHAGLSREKRQRIEHAFRNDVLSCVVSTSAFGEGVNLPNIRNVVLYHMPFGATEFNQMSGRAGRDGKPSHIHVLFGSRDARINESLLASSAPARSDLVTLYRVLRTEAQRQSGMPLTYGNADLASLAHSVDPSVRLDESSVASGIAVFDELGFLHEEGYKDRRAIVMNTSPQYADLATSVRYCEGKRSLREFLSFRDWVLSATPQEMLSRINRPIVPGFGKTVGR